jgi:hypothetical protein
MITHLLDTSAWLAHALHEPGSDVVAGLLLNADHQVGVSVLSLFELHGRMRQLGAEDRFNEIVADYKTLFAAILAVDEPVANRAVDLRRAAGARVPAIDAFIAATAAHHNAVLVHRDPHFSSLPEEAVRQQALY